MADIEIAIPELPSLVARYGTRAGPVVASELKAGGDRAGKAFRDVAIHNLKNPSGPVAGSVQLATTVSGYAASTRVHTEDKVARYLEEGTGIYGPRGGLIRPTSKRALAFVVNGDAVVVRWVRGIKPQRWWSRAKAEAKGAIDRAFADVPRRIVDRMTRGGG